MLCVNVQGKGEITEKSELTLRDVLDSPEFRNVFIGFLEDNLALENVKFLEAVQGYKGESYSIAVVYKMHVCTNSI